MIAVPGASGDSSPSPNPAQLEALVALDESRRSGQTSALVVMAPGLGKTLLAAWDAHSVAANGRTLYLAHRGEILDQAAKTFVSVFGTDVPYLKLHEEGNGRSRTVPLVFSTIQTMYRRFREWPTDHFDYIVIDESHHVVAPTYHSVVAHFAPRFRLGITATPRRMDRQDILPTFNNNVAFDLPIEKAVVLDYLASINYRIYTDIIVEDFAETSRSAISLVDLDQRLFRPRAFSDIASLFQSEFESLSDPRAILFCPSIDAANMVQSEIPEVEVVTSQTSLGVRRRTVERFRTGDVRAIAAVDIFNEGIDIPDANLLVFLRSTSSETVFLQQLGRGLRKTRSKTEVLVLDFVAYLERLLYLRRFRDNIEHFKRTGTPETSHLRNRIGRNEIVFDSAGRQLLEEIERSRFTPEQIEILEVSVGVDELAKELNVPVYRLNEPLSLGVLHPDVRISIFPGASYPYFLRSRIDEVSERYSSWERQPRVFPVTLPELQGQSARQFLTELSELEYAPELREFYARGKEYARRIKST